MLCLLPLAVELMRELPSSPTPVVQVVDALDQKPGWLLSRISVPIVVMRGDRESHRRRSGRTVIGAAGETGRHGVGARGGWRRRRTGAGRLAAGVVGEGWRDAFQAGNRRAVGTRYQGGSSVRYRVVGAAGIGCRYGRRCHCGVGELIGRHGGRGAARRRYGHVHRARPGWAGGRDLRVGVDRESGRGRRAEMHRGGGGKVCARNRHGRAAGCHAPCGAKAADRRRSHESELIGRHGGRGAAGRRHGHVHRARRGRGGRRDLRVGVTVKAVAGTVPKSTAVAAVKPCR